MAVLQYKAHVPGQLQGVWDFLAQESFLNAVCKERHVLKGNKDSIKSSVSLLQRTAELHPFQKFRKNMMECVGDPLQERHVVGER